MRKTGAAIDVDISILVSIIGTYYFNFSYLANVKNIAIALKDLSDFKTFGMPPGMSDFNMKLNTISKWHQVYICMAIISLTSSDLLEIQACEAKNIERGIKDVCGLSIKIWVPFDIDYFPVKQVIFLIQTYSGYFSYATSSTISFSVMESMEHVVFRLIHVKILFVKALNEDVYEIRKESLRHCIQYHNFVISYFLVKLDPWLSVVHSSYPRPGAARNICHLVTVIIQDFHNPVLVSLDLLRTGDLLLMLPRSLDLLLDRERLSLTWTSS
ncbi:hypothetical protein NQ318_018469 [Aromia moschata]|uniref:Maturase K n=1 Tax=Aromia moschata TaxID=1265417 RepID=A0AAV8YN17_9CUCU|nr:hypothetical protein NQ318_018469 [Aromia moschata]